MLDCVRFINYLIIIINQFGALSDILPSFSSDRSSSIGMPWYYFLPLTTVSAQHPHAYGCCLTSLYALEIYSHLIHVEPDHRFLDDVFIKLSTWPLYDSDTVYRCRDFTYLLN